VLKRAKRELQLSFNAAEGTPAFDTSEHETYTDEEPNALTSEETAAFLACMKQEFPAQYAMTSSSKDGAALVSTTLATSSVAVTGFGRLSASGL
jgi:hypothetical protein